MGPPARTGAIPARLQLCPRQDGHGLLRCLGARPCGADPRPDLEQQGHHPVARAGSIRVRLPDEEGGRGLAEAARAGAVSLTARRRRLACWDLGSAAVWMSVTNWV